MRWASANRLSVSSSRSSAPYGKPVAAMAGCAMYAVTFRTMIGSELCSNLTTGWLGSRVPSAPRNGGVLAWVRPRIGYDLLLCIGRLPCVDSCSVPPSAVGEDRAAVGYFYYFSYSGPEPARMRNDWTP